MKDLDVKKSILEEIIKLMDDQEGEILKKHPKIAKVSVQSNDQELADELKDKVIEGAEEVSEKEPKKEEEELDEETLEKLKQMYAKLK